MISIHDSEGLEKHRSARRLDPGWVRALRNGFYKKGLTREQTLATLPDGPRRALADGIRFHALEKVEARDSSVDRATKIVFRTARGLLVESVLMRIDTGRTTVCVSSQVGCAAHCAFCASGQMGVSVSLSADEILDQVIQANLHLREEGRRLRNVVFMGMGEPFHNEDGLYGALEVLASTACFDHPQRFVLVSTVGIPEAMERFAKRFPRTHLALSLHSARQEIREGLIPLARRYPLPRLREALRQVTATQGGRVMIEYLLLRGRNDGPEDLRALVEFLTGIPVMINLIPYNPISETDELERTLPDRAAAFADDLRAGGFQVTRRYSLGSDIAAACGQLTLRENRRIVRDLARSSL